MKHFVYRTICPLDDLWHRAFSRLYGVLPVLASAPLEYVGAPLCWLLDWSLGDGE